MSGVWVVAALPKGILEAVFPSSVSLSVQRVVAKTSSPPAPLTVLVFIRSEDSRPQDTRIPFPSFCTLPPCFSGFHAPCSRVAVKAAGLAIARARPLPPAWPSLRAHKAPGADVRAPLCTAGPQCRRSCAALPPRPGEKSQAASPA